MKTALEQSREDFPDFDDVPACIEEALREELIVCTAYSNDMCPSFMLKGKPGEPGALQLFTDYKAEELRGSSWRDPKVDPVPPRFHIMDSTQSDDFTWSGDDAEEALRRLLFGHPPSTKPDAAEIQKTIDRVALHFVTNLMQRIGAAKMREVARLNRTAKNPHECHTHDFVDANVVMAEAFTGVTGREILDAVQAQYAAGTEFEHDDKIWSAAWTKAREMIQERFPAS